MLSFLSLSLFGGVDFDFKFNFMASSLSCSVRQTRKMASDPQKRNIVIIGPPPSLTQKKTILTPLRRRHYRLYVSLLPHPPPFLQPFPPQDHNSRSAIHSLSCIRQSRRSPRPVGIPILHCPALIQAPRRACARTRWREEMGI